MVGLPLQITCDNGCSTSAFGLTVIVKVLTDPLQVTPALVYVGVTTIVDTTGETPVFKVGKPMIGPVPLETNPIVVLLFVQV